MNDGLLYYIIDWIGNIVERAGPAIYKLLALVLPYLSPVPIAAYTSNSVTTFLGLTPRQSILLVFVLEAVGLWVTTMLVESVVDVIASRNRKVILMTIVFTIATVVYIIILVTLNVTLKSGQETAALQRVVTLICFLPLLTGVCNGAYRLRLKGEVATSSAFERRLRLEDEERQRRWQIEDDERKKNQARLDAEALAESERKTRELELKHQEKLERLRVKAEKKKGTTDETSSTQVETVEQGSSTSEGKMSPIKRQVWNLMDKAWDGGRGRVLTHKELVLKNIDKSSAFRHRNSWLEAHPEAPR